jgi:hypothetical protein
VSDVRSDIAKALEGKLTPEHLDFLMNEVLAITKTPHVEVTCKKCGQRQKVKASIPDAKAVSDSVINLANQAWGRPDVASLKDEDRIIFKRLTKLEEDDA